MTRTPVLRDSLLDEWVFLGGPRGEITMAEFAERTGTTFAAWDRMFLRAQAAGDARAVRRVKRPRFRRDEVLAQWAAVGERSHIRFALHVGMTYTAWRSMFDRARRAGDPRAVRPT